MRESRTRNCVVTLLSLGMLSLAGYTTYSGDAYPIHITAMITDAAGNTYLTGARQITSSSTDVVVTKLDPSGKRIFTTAIAGKGSDQANSIAVDTAGNIYVGGTTSSVDFPLSRALQSAPAPYGTGFL